ncbi:MAG: tRNA (adenosine(37)-N6)-dimethylallyltransferase MiaA [Ignavibacteria bacterium]|nr:tRNA (adenosine(37)-N6)-dimethylallyltransferase MiaA [Ignavibacteria bacterium]MBT8381920.1 tRNA (adenosine(37)-N6)-dimethylallyltransferase MiaA [Ignavibacteria bacterium]MBT8393141.1 tRNA (adenosine(37)-N6)-dimethylallyltransferase MiaA [Ignavibacteria bacterium]NNJ52635.1 tRNA (adenosine(37)-N6)-dimethylallyltransferase MiaA [Ignavibacteriaceae bacterium]NNL21139.1 tRNA (adenosine(37)-N6)-dimethylallyltransferase MiaA [Ignavibacteriaceae bacterium]
MNYNLITILGPTATGKTSIAAKLAAELNGEIISADSRQVYIGMDIGTGKDLNEIKYRNVNYHLIDICEPTEEYNLFRFKKDFNAAFREITAQKKFPILVGGTVLYISSVLQNYLLPQIKSDEEKLKKLLSLDKNELLMLLFSLSSKLHNTTDLINKERIIKAILIEQSKENLSNEKSNIVSLNIGIKPERSIINQNITGRLKARLKSGMIKEVEALLQKGIKKEKLKFFGLEYRYLTQYVTGELNYNDMFQKLNSAIHNFSKRQLTWFRKMEKEGVEINWFKGTNYDEILYFTKAELNKKDANT